MYSQSEHNVQCILVFCKTSEGTIARVKLPNRLPPMLLSLMHSFVESDLPDIAYEVTNPVCLDYVVVCFTRVPGSAAQSRASAYPEKSGIELMPIECSSP